MLVAGGLSAEDTPVPIPNTVVKLCRADGTAEGTWWESTSLPAHMLGSSFGVGPSFLCSDQGVATYSILYPKARIKTLVVFFYFIRVMPIPAWVFLGIWIAMQFLGLGAAAAGDGGGIAYAAHLGGLFAGLGLVFLFRKTKPATAWM